MNREEGPGRRTFHLSAAQADYLAKQVTMDAPLREMISGGRSVDLDLAKNERDDIVEQLGTRLQRAGFDSEWSATDEGLIIEGIIDVLTTRQS